MTDFWKNVTEFFYFVHLFCFYWLFVIEFLDFYKNTFFLKLIYLVFVYFIVSNERFWMIFISPLRLRSRVFVVYHFQQLFSQSEKFSACQSFCVFKLRLVSHLVFSCDSLMLFDV